MFMNTIAVGPLDDVASCVTGGTMVAMDCLWWAFCQETAIRDDPVAGVANFDIAVVVARRVSCWKGLLKAMK